MSLRPRHDDEDMTTMGWDGLSQALDDSLVAVGREQMMEHDDHEPPARPHEFSVPDFQQAMQCASVPRGRFDAIYTNHVPHTVSRYVFTVLEYNPATGQYASLCTGHVPFFPHPQPAGYVVVSSMHGQAIALVEVNSPNAPPQLVLYAFRAGGIRVMQYRMHEQEQVFERELQPALLGGTRAFCLCVRRE